ncbi:MAG TPA: TPM domain-containing protein [Chitinophagaceae bacterium]|nr:TPM domain-containing protein [Chitinophagaceae bacterium]
MFSLFRKNRFFTEEEQQQILQAIQQAEKETSGEIRVFVESKCSYMDALDRAKEIFSRLNMQDTTERNAVLIYVAVKHHQLAIFGDEAIHKKVGNDYWGRLVKQMVHHFHKNNIAEGIRLTIMELGHDLQKHFPHHKYIDKNELPDDIVFGR